MSSSDKTKLNGIDSGANKTVVDNALSDTSVNPVQNKVVTSALKGKQATLSAGTNISIVDNVISAVDTKYGVVTQSANGLMSSADKKKIDSIESGAQKNAVTGVKGNSESAYRTGNVEITKANIGLGNVDDTSDMNKPISTAVQNALNKKQATMSGGTGISLNGATINHSNSVTAQTSYVGSATSVPMIKYDAQGHITSTSTATIYPPTTPGNAGQVWVSDGSGAGAWKTLVTISTSDPSGGSNGDLWFKYE